MEYIDIKTSSLSFIHLSLSHAKAYTISKATRNVNVVKPKINQFYNF